jgi:pimeloyl-ACP methyl ester carboxylesterase
MTPRVWAESAGETTSPLAVVVHGSMDRSAGLLRLSRRLDAEHRVIRYDRRGYGRSVGVGPPWTVEANVDDLELLLDEALDVSHATAAAPPAILFGHSFGGNVALALAQRRPELVRAVVVYETPLSWLDWWPGNSAGAAAMAVDDPGDAAEAFMRRLVGDAVWERLPAAKQAERRSEGAAMVAELADLRRRAPWEGDRVDVPVLALHGEHARPHHRAAMQGLAELIGRCRSASVSGAGHAGPHTHADAVAAAMAPFLASLSEGSSASAG